MAEGDYHPAADREYTAAAEWYLDRNPSAARRFVAEVEGIRKQLRIRSDYYGWYDDDFREAVLVHFPFSVIYRTDSQGDSGAASPANQGL